MNYTCKNAVKFVLLELMPRKSLVVEPDSPVPWKTH